MTQNKPLYKNWWFLIVSGLIIVPLAIFLAPFLIGGYATFKAFKSSKVAGTDKLVLVSSIVLVTLISGFIWSSALLPNDTASLEAQKQVSQDKLKEPATKESTQTTQLQQTTNSNDMQKTISEKVTVVSVTDGDTVRVSLDGKNVPVRLIGIDSPELSHPSEPVQCYSQEAKQALADLILNKEVTIETDKSDTDKYSRLLRYLWVDEVLVNEYMAQNGYAFASSYPPDTKFQKRINAGQESAKSKQLGLWASNTCKGDVYTGTYKDPNKVTSTTQDNTSPANTPPYIAPIAPTPTTSEPATSPTSGYSCNCSKTCPQMNSCEEAQYQLNVCGCSARDNDDDGIACDADCQ